MGTSTTADVKRLLDLAVRMGIPTSDALHQVRDMHSEPDPADEAHSVRRVETDPTSRERRS